MSLSKETAFEILGLPSFATTEEIILRYKALALEWFPEKHKNSEISLEIFSNISRAAVRLLDPQKKGRESELLIDLSGMYSFFQFIFFRGGKHDDDCHDCECQCECDNSDGGSTIFEDEVPPEFIKEELKAANKAAELIFEEELQRVKSQRKKEKKKRRKERKKQQKSENSKPSNQVNAKTSSLKKENQSSSDSEEDLDPNSAFVSTVAKKHNKTIPGLQPKTDISNAYFHNHYQPDIAMDEEDPELIMQKSRKIALEGNQRANEGKYSEAVKLFTESITLDPADHRFYGNRSYCYDRLNLFDKALKDADKAIKLCPTWPKGYFRKGRALLGLKKYAVAEKFFLEVLRLDNDCEDAIVELRKSRLLQIMAKGFSKEAAESALAAHASVPEALESLLSNGIYRIQSTNDIEIFISDDEIENVEKTPPKPKPVVKSAFYDIKKDPKNPEGHNSLWVGNVQNDVTEKKLIQMFGKYGELISVKIMPEKFCAFINYKSKASPGKAMEAYQGFELSGYNLVIRFPNLPGETTPVTAVKKANVAKQESKKQGPVNGNECYFWRTTGCVYGNMCHYEHVKAHKGIDRKGWQIT